MTIDIDVPHSMKDTEIVRAVNNAVQTMIRQQHVDGYWVYELEADATIPAEYILLRHYRGEAVDTALEQKVATYLRRIQGEHGGWPLYHDGPFDLSASVKAYFALKMIGDSPDAPHMRRARNVILSRGGAVHSNVFTRILLALYGIVTWGCVPIMPAEIVLLPEWFPFHLSKVSYWARTVMVPLFVLQALKPRAKNTRGITVSELFHGSPQSVGLAPKAAHQSWVWFLFFRIIDVMLRHSIKFIPKNLRQRAIERAAEFVTERLNGKNGLGAIFPAMANATMMFDALFDVSGDITNKTKAAIARDSIERLLIIKDSEAYCQPCLSPVWDTVLASQALLEVGSREAIASVRKGLDWLVPLQVLDIKGDWATRRPTLKPGGWAFQYDNPYYPDLDDTAVIVMAMDRLRRLESSEVYDKAITRAVEWVKGMQSTNGGWAAFDVDNTYEYLNNIPFADHGALVDPPTEDVTARCVSMLAQLGGTLKDQPVARGVQYLLSRQTSEGSWFGRWGLNYIYGTWSVLCALNAAGISSLSPEVRRAALWLFHIQNKDGGWGEDGSSYRLDYKGHESAPSTASQTAWAMLALMAAGEAGHPAVARGAHYLAQAQQDEGSWNEERFTGTGFPRVFYLRYHGYRKYFPLWALARYRNLSINNNSRVHWGM
jgi:squalene-hopene/tetraprenyl-beta-curcumene cyclase